MNLEELQIKIGIELKELNKQLKKASDDINEHIGPKATKKMMSENNKAIKRGLDEIRRTTKYSIKQMRKDTTEEIDDMSKDIHKSLTKAFDIDLTKFNKNIDSSMAQAKRSVRSACNDIRRELNAALNIKANIRVSSSASVSKQRTNSKSDTAAILASSQYTAAMMVKAINAMIDTNNKNATRLENTINKCTDRIIAALNKSNKATGVTTVQDSHPSQRTAKVKNPKKVKTTTKGQLVGQPYGPDNRALIDALKNTYKTINILNRNLSALNSLKNIKQLGTGSNAYGHNGMQGGTVNWRQGRRGETTSSFKGEVVNPIAVSIPVEPFKQIQDIIEVINYEIKDFETALVKINSRAVSVAKTLNDFKLSKTGSQPLEGEIIDSGKLAKNKAITQKEVIIPAEFKIIDDDLERQINETVKKIKGTSTGLNAPDNSNPLLPDLTEAQKRFDAIKKMMKGLSLQEVLGKTSFDLTEWEALEELMRTLPNGVSKAKVIMYQLAEAVKELGFESIEAYAKFNKLMGIDPLAGNKKQKPQRPDGFVPKQGVPGQATKPQRPDWYNPTPGIEKTLNVESQVDEYSERIETLSKSFDFFHNKLTELIDKIENKTISKSGARKVINYLTNEFEALGKKVDEVTPKLKDLDSMDLASDMKKDIAENLQSLKNLKELKLQKSSSKAKEIPVGITVNTQDQIDDFINNIDEALNQMDADQLEESLKRVNKQLDNVRNDIFDIMHGFSMFEGETLDDIVSKQLLYDLEEIKKRLGASKNSLDKIRNNFKDIDVDTSGIDKLENKLQAIRDSRTNLRKQVKGGSYDETAITPIARALKDADNVQYGEPSDNSLGFLPYKKGLNDLVESAKKAGEKIKKALFGKSKDGSNELAITIDDESANKIFEVVEEIDKNKNLNLSFEVDINKLVKDLQKSAEVFNNWIDDRNKNLNSAFDVDNEAIIDSYRNLEGFNSEGNGLSSGEDSKVLESIKSIVKDFDAIVKDFDKSVKEFKSCVDRLAKRDARKELEFEIDNSLKELDDFRDRVRGITSEADFDNALEELDSLRNKVEELTGEEIKFDFEISDEEFENRIDKAQEKLEDLRKELGVVEVEPEISDEEFDSRIDSMLKQLEDLRKELGVVEVEPTINDEEFENQIDKAQEKLEDLRKELEAFDSKKGKSGPSKPTTLGFGLGGFKNEIDTIIEYAKKAGSKIRKALADAFKHKESSKSNPFSNGINIEKSTVNGETKTTVNGKDLKDLTSEELDAYNKVMSESNKAYTDAMKNLNNAMNGMAGSFSNDLESSLNNLGDSINESVKRSMDVMNDPNLLKILKDKGIKPGDSFDETFIDQYGNKTRVKSNYTDNSIHNNNLNNGYNGKDIKDLASEKLKDLNSAMAEMEKEFGNFNDAMDNFNKSIEEMTKSVSDSIKEVPKTDNAPNKVNPTINDAQEDTGGRDNKPLGSSLFNKAKKELDKLSNAVKNTVSKLNSSISKFASNTKAKLSNAFASIKPIKLYSSITSGLNKAKSAVSKFASNARTKLNNAFTGIKFGKLYANIASGLNKAKAAITKFASYTRAKLSNAFAGVTFGKLYASVSSALNKAKGAVSKFAGKVRPILSKAFKNINLSNIGGTISKGLNKAKGALSKFANGCKTIWGKIKQIFSKGASDASKATGKLTTSLKGLLARALGFFSLYGLINLGKQAITQSQTLAQAEVKLTSLMKQRMGATNETVRAIRNLAKEQANLGVVSETAMVRGAEQLSMYVHSAKALQELMPAIANMTARRGGFNATPEDAEEIATQLGEAIREGTTTPLEQSGIYLNQAEIEKFKELRTEEERAEFLADKIAENVGDINKALANTPHGQIAQLKNNFQALLGTLGTLLVNVIQPIVKWLNVVVVAANNALKALGELLGFDMTGGGLAGVDLGTGSTGTETDTSGIDGATDSLEDAKDAAGEAEEAVEKFKGSLMGFDEINILSNNTDKKEDDPTNITPGEGGQLTPGDYESPEMTEGENIFTKFGEKMKAFMDEVLEPFKKAWELYGNDLKEEWKDLVDSFKNACDSLASFLKSVWDNGGKEFVQHFAEIILAVAKAAMEIGGEILDSLARLWDHLDPSKNMHTQRLLDVLNEVSEKIRDFILGLGDHFESLMANGGQDVLNAMGDCFMDLGAAAVNGLGVAIDALDGLIDHLDPAVNENTHNMLQALADMFHATGQAAWDFSELLKSALANGGQDMINAFGDMMMNLGETVARVITTMMESFSAFFDYIDPENNDITKNMMKSWEEAFLAIGDAALEFADLFESVMDNGGQEVLNKLGDAFNSLVGLVGDCVKEIADALDGLFEHLDPKTNQFTQDMLSAWERAFEDIADMCDSLSDLIGSAMDNGGQELVNSVGDLGMKLGEAFGVVVEECAETFSGLFDHMNPENNEHSKKMMDALDGLVDSITEFVDACVEAFQKFMDNGGREIVNNLGDILAIVIDLAAELGSGIIDIITGFMNSWVGQTLIEGVAQALEWVTDKLVGLSDAFDVVKDIFQNIVDIIVGVFEGDGEKVGKAFANLIKNAFKLTGELLQWLWDIGCDIVEGLVKGICALPELLWDAVQFIFDTIVSFFKELFGIHSPSTVFAELGEFLIEGLAQGITDCVNSVKDAFKKIGDAISDATKEIKEAVSEKFKEIKDDIKEKLKETKEVVSEKWGEIKTTVSEKAKETYEAAKEKWKNIKDTVSDRSKETYETVKEKFGDIYNTVKDKAGDTYEKVSESWTKMKEDAGKKLEQIKTDAEKKYDQVKSSLVKKIGEVKTETVNKWNEVKDSTIEGIEKVREKAEEKYESIKETMTRKLEQIKSTTSSKWEEIKKDTADKVESLRTTAEEKYDSLKEKLLTKLENTKASMGSKWDAIKSEAVKKCGEMATEAHNKFSDIKGKFTSKMDEIKSTLGPKWDNLKSQASTKASEIATKAGEGFNSISSTASKALETARTSVSNGLSKIGSLFSSTSWSLPKIKMPHFSISGSFSLNPPSVPKFSVEWYKRGGIIDGITPLGFTGGTMHMGGEAGKEMVVPLENTSFTSKIAKAIGQAVDNTMARNFNNSSNGDSPYVNDSRDVVLQVDGREFARASINSINKLQRESGRTLLDI